MKKAAVIGAGFSGIAACWHLVQSGWQVVVYDRVGLGGGASGIAAGLLHSYVGAQSKKNWRGDEGLAETLSLLEIASICKGSCVHAKKGMLRQALTEKQLTDFKKAAEAYEDIDWWEAPACKAQFSALVPAPGIFINNTYMVNSAAYLEGLWSACSSKGASLIIQEVKSLSELSAYAAVVVATGADCNELLVEEAVALTQVKGQILELAASPPPFPINSSAYFLQFPGEKYCILGATYEKRFLAAAPDQESAFSILAAKAATMGIRAGVEQVRSCRAGFRASLPGHLPLWKKIKERLWIITGMGSRGLLYHALGAKELVASINQESS